VFVGKIFVLMFYDGLYYERKIMTEDGLRVMRDGTFSIDTLGTLDFSRRHFSEGDWAGATCCIAVCFFPGG